MLVLTVSWFFMILAFARGQGFYPVTIKVVDIDGDLIHTFGSMCDPQSKQFKNVLKGITVLSNPPNACKPIAPPPNIFNGTVSKFVLINSSNLIDCLSDIKAKNAEDAGFDLALIYGNDVWTIVRHFQGNKIGIPILHIGHDDGLEIQSRYLYKNRSSDIYFMKVFPPPNDISYYIMLFAIIIGICLIVMLFFIICLLIKCIQARRQSMRNRLSSRQIRQLRTATFKRGDQYDVCAICLEEYKEGDKLRILPCSHAYHTQCIDPWLRENRRTCPLCKLKIRFGGESSGSDSESEMTSAAEDTPLLGSVQAQGNQSLGTFSVRRHIFDDLLNQHILSEEAQQEVAAAQDSEVEKSADVPSTTGSINSCDGASVEFYSCDLPQDWHVVAESQHDRLV